MSTPLDIQYLLRRRYRLRAPWPNLRQLSLDFHSDEEAVPVYTGEDEAGATEEVEKALAKAPDNFDDLNEAAAYAHWICLTWHINAFAHARNQKQRDDVLQWFLGPPRISWCEKDLSKVDPLLVPFSFELCCLLEEVDADALRTGILNLNKTLQGKPLRRRPYESSNEEDERSAPCFSEADRAPTGREDHQGRVRCGQQEPHPGLGSPA